MKKPGMLVFGISGGLLLIAVAFAHWKSRWECGPGSSPSRMTQFFPDIYGGFSVYFDTNGDLGFGLVVWTCICLAALALAMYSGKRGPRIAGLAVLVVVVVYAACCMAQHVSVRLPLWCNVNERDRAEANASSAKQSFEDAEADPNTSIVVRRRLWFEYKKARTRFINWDAHVKEHGHTHFR